MQRWLIMAGIALTIFLLLFSLQRRSTSLPDDPWFQQEVVRQERPVVVDFTATWCGPCHEMSRQLERLEKEYPNQFHVVKVDVDQRGDLARHFDVTAMPTLLVVRDGRVVDRQRGLGAYEELKRFVTAHL